jgi:pimeloyl-ACP methyl ester carboxylesterase
MDDYATVTLSDGRTLAYGECGRGDGEPVLCFHGVPGSRRMWALLDEVARDNDARVIAPERPGFGHSEFQSGRRLSDWPADVRELADELGLETFGVVGFSGGGPHAAACAHELPERVTRAVLVSSVGPPDVHEYAGAYEQTLRAATQYVPGFSESVFGFAGMLARHWRPQFRASIVGKASKPDRALFDEPEGDLLVDDAVEAFRRGGRGPAHEFPLLDRNWSFDPAEIDVPVAMYHGSADHTVDERVVRAFADVLPDAELTVVDEGHYSTLVRNRGAIFAAALPEQATA